MSGIDKRHIGVCGKYLTIGRKSKQLDFYKINLDCVSLNFLASFDSFSFH